MQLPGYERSRTLVVLMGVARLEQVVKTLTECDVGGQRDGAAYPTYTPVAIIERASMPDQRVIASTLRDISTALASSGEQRPPGMMVIGWAVLALWAEGDVTVLDDKGEIRDEDRVKKWLRGDCWNVREGLDSSWEWV